MNVGTLYVDPVARPRPVFAARLQRVAATAPSLADYVEQLRWMHPYYPALRRALADEMKGANQPRRVRLLALNRDRARVLPRGTGDYILVNSVAARLDFYEDASLASNFIGSFPRQYRRFGPRPTAQEPNAMHVLSYATLMPRLTLY